MEREKSKPKKKKKKSSKPKEESPKGEVWFSDCSPAYTLL